LKFQVGVFWVVNSLHPEDGGSEVHRKNGIIP